VTETKNRWIASRRDSTFGERIWTRRSTATLYTNSSWTTLSYIRPTDRRNCTWNSSIFSLFCYRVDWTSTTPITGQYYHLCRGGVPTLVG